jgi:hypothetical protein
LPLDILVDGPVLYPNPWAPDPVERKKTGLKVLSYAPSLTNRNDADILVTLEGAGRAGGREVSLTSPIDKLVDNLTFIMEGGIYDIIPGGK